MYTRCPNCKTKFSVSEAQLQVAQGKVRCGSCKNVFNARQHIYYRSSTSTTEKKQPKTTPSVAEKISKPTYQSKSPAKPPTKPETKIKPEIKSSQSKEPSTSSSIDAIFNALDSQLSSGTYIDIAQSNTSDIREADFDDDLEEAEISDTQQQPADDIDESLLDLDIVNTELKKETLINESPDLSAKHTEPLSKTKTTSTEKNTQQDAFDFLNLNNSTKHSAENEKQFLAVNKSFNTQSDLVKKDKNADLHQAIDNIIKVDNKTTTPFEEHDEDHFVIEIQSQPDVELVGANEIDKLFASTDNLKISDLKFDKHLTTKQENPSSILELDETQEKFKHIPKIESEDKKNDTVFNQQVKEQLKPESLNLDSHDNIQIDTHYFDDEPHSNISKDDIDENTFQQDNNKQTDFDSDGDEFVIENNNFDIDEEIILASPSNNEDDLNVPHRLRDAVSSFNQETPKLSTTKRLLYSFFSIALIIMLLTQLVLFKNTALANGFPMLQPLLSSLCNKLPCRYTGNHNSKQIKIISRDVRLHPKIKGALLISATIKNQANYSQPYPTILLKFTDLTGATVAQRYFPPSAYLGLLNKPFALMPSKKPIQLNIEILDPGSDAINFQFFFL